MKRRALRRRYGRSEDRPTGRARPKPAKVIIYGGDSRHPWEAKVYDDAGNLRSGVKGYATSHAHHEFPHGHTEREYVEARVKEWWPGLPVEYRQR